MIVKFFNPSLQYDRIKLEIDSAIQRVLTKGDLILRQDVEIFEERLAQYVGAKYAVGLNSGTDALFFALKVSEVGRGDEVITTSHGFVAPISAIKHCGAEPVLVDVGEDYLMDMEKVEEAITLKTKAIIPIHLNGKVCDMEKLTSIFEGIVIEDAAQALGAKIGLGDIACFSFYPAKILGSLGDAGAITTDNKEIADKIRLLRDHCITREDDEIKCFGFNSRMDNLQAAVLNTKLKYLPQWINRRKEIARMYDKGLDGVVLPPIADIYQNYVIKAQKRDELFEFLKENGIETQIKDRVPNHLQKNLGLKFNLPVTERLSNEVISLPIYPELTNEEVEFVIKKIKEFYER